MSENCMHGSRVIRRRRAIRFWHVTLLIGTSFQKIAGLVADGFKVTLPLRATGIARQA